MTQRRAAAVLTLTFAAAVVAVFLLMRLGVHWAVYGPLSGLMFGLAVHYLGKQPVMRQGSRPDE